MAICGAHSTPQGDKTPIAAESSKHVISSSLSDYECPENLADAPDEFKCECARADDISSFINYEAFHYCHMRKAPGFSIFLGFLGVTFLIYCLVSTTDNFLVPALDRVSTFLSLPPNVAGVTLLALGNGAADVASSFASFKDGDGSIALGSVLGAGVLVTTLVLGSVSIAAKEFTPVRAPFIRDVLFYLISIVFLFVIFLDGVATLPEAIFFLLWYLAYVLTVVVGFYLQQQHTSTTRGPATRVPLLEEGFGVSGDMQVTPGGIQLQEQKRRGSDSVDVSDVPLDEPAGSAASLSAMEGDVNNNTTTTTTSTSTTASSSAATVPEDMDVLAGYLKERTRARAHSTSDAGDLWALSAGTSSSSSSSATSSATRSRSDSSSSSSDHHPHQMLPSGDHQPTAEESSPATQQQQQTVWLPLPQLKCVWFAQCCDFRSLMREDSCWGKFRLYAARFFSVVLLTLEGPFTLGRLLTIPSLGDDEEDESAETDSQQPPSDEQPSPPRQSTVNPTLLALSPLFGALLLCTIMGGGSLEFGLVFLVASAPSVWLMSRLRNVPVSATTGRLQLPKTVRLMVHIQAFVLSLVWVYIIANELVSLLTALGVAMNLSRGVLGLTILAWGNSAGDILANIGLAKNGNARMAVAGCLGGPTFNLLFGLGLGLTYRTASTYPTAFPFPKLATAPLAFLFLFISLALTLFVIPLVFKFKFTKRYGMGLCAFYGLFLFLGLLSETGALPHIPWGRQ